MVAKEKGLEPLAKCLFVQKEGIFPEEEAQKWLLGLSASGIHTLAICTKLLVEISEMSEPVAAAAGLGYDEMRMLLPVRPGDSVYARSRVESKRSSVSQPDKGIVVCVNELVNQDGDVVLRYKSSSLILKRPTNLGLSSEEN